ncbi:MAG: T6SS immunity protein Tli4 family protein, partial [Pararobbsia sp.]
MHKVRAKRRVLLITLTVLLTFGPSINRSAAAPPHQEISVNWMESPQTFCIGRFVLQMPANFQSKWQKYTYNGSEIEITPNVSRLRFDDIVREREHELTDKMRTDNSGRTLLQTDISWLEKVVSPQSTSRLFIFRDSNNRDIKLGLGYVTEGYVWDDGAMFLFKSDAAETRVDAAVAADSDIMGRIKARDNHTVPTEPGYCFNGGLITGGTEFFELAKAYFERPSTPGGAIFGVEMRPNLPSDDTLFERVPKLAQMMGNLISHTRTLRRRERPLAGLDGQEMLTQISANGVTAYYFIWEAKGAPDSVIHPNTHIELRIGGEHNKQTNRRESSALSEEDALVLWDIMLNSFHLRPGAL